MTRPSGPVMYPVGWIGLIGSIKVKITEIRVGSWRLKKAVRINAEAKPRQEAV